MSPSPVRAQVVAAPLLVLTLTGIPLRAASPEFAAFDQRARQGERLNVVFFGASLTWGANASDPLLTSYRAIIARRLEETYPQARLKFWDAAIGGTGSQLGVFRLQRDVLRRQPDLVFLDFSANDDIYTADPETLASYEALVRRLVTEAKCPVVQVIFPFQWNVAQGNTGGMKRREAHLEIAKTYRTAAGDAITLAIQRVQSGQTTLKKIWPVDGIHPCDDGYQVFADAAWDAFQEAVRDKQVCAAPAKMLNSNTYMTSARVRISSLGPLPEGWRVGAPNVVSAFFDFLMSRWLDDEVIASNRRASTDPSAEKKALSQTVAPLRLRFQGSMVMLLGETTPKSGKYRVHIDGKLIRHTPYGAKEPLSEFDAGALARRIGGNGHHAQAIATGLDPAAEHSLQIEPVLLPDQEQELRLESVCVAGGKATVDRGP